MRDGSHKRLAGRLGAGALAFGALAALGSRPAQAATVFTDTDYLTFLLNIEYLQAEYYLRAVTGQGVPAGYGGVAGNVTVPARTLVPFETPAVAYWAEKIANDQLAHVIFLVTLLGENTKLQPGINLTTSFSTVLQQAGLITKHQTFNPFANEVDFLVGAYVFEDVGVSAHAGLIELLTTKANIAYVASNLATEAMHAGLVRSYLAQIGGGQATNAISSLRQSLSGVPDRGTDLSASGGNAFAFVNGDYNGQVYRRTPPQVLNILFGQPGFGVTSGLFFPGKPTPVTGNIKST